MFRWEYIIGVLLPPFNLKGVSVDEDKQVKIRSPFPKENKRNKKWLWVIRVIVLILLLALFGYIVWQLKECSDQHEKDTKQEQSLQAQIDDLKKQLAAQSKSISLPSTDKTTGGSCSPQKELTQEVKDNLAAAISSKNTAALEGYMASSVNVVFAASEKSGFETPAKAITDLSYLDSALAPWNFNLPATTLNSYKAGSYKQYFEGVTYVGKSADGHVIAYSFDTCAKINQIFVSVSDDLL